MTVTQLKRAGEDCRLKTARVKLERWKRDEAIRRALAEGMSPTAVAHACGLSRQTVHRIASKPSLAVFDELLQAFYQGPICP